MGGQESTITTGLYQECLHQGSGQDRVCPLRTGTFFCTKVIIKAQLLLIQGHYGWMISELKRIFFVVFCFVLLFLETKKLSFFA